VFSEFVGKCLQQLTANCRENKVIGRKPLHPKWTKRLMAPGVDRREGQRCVQITRES
jgi:hypothetical protein